MLQGRNLMGVVAGFVAGAMLMVFAAPWAMSAQNAQIAAPYAPGTALVANEFGQPVAVRPANIVTSRASVAPRRVATAPAKPKRSWQKTALVIGGSAGAGAGIGGMVKGGKGALIGAALGGGAAAIYEAIKRHDR